MYLTLNVIGYINYLMYLKSWFLLINVIRLSIDIIIETNNLRERKLEKRTPNQIE